MQEQCRITKQSLLFAQHIKLYNRERLGIEFITSDRGFVGYNTDGTDLTITDWYVTPESTFWDAIRLVRQAISIGKQLGCTRLIGGNETTLPTYGDINKLHKWFGMTYLGDNGTLELWSKPI